MILRPLRFFAAAVLVAMLLPISGRTAHAAAPASFAATVGALEALPYQPAYVPTGTDAAFPPAVQPNGIPVANTPPVNDYTAGSIVGSNGQPYDPTGVSGAPPWPSTFTPLTIPTPDGAHLTGWAHITSGSHPAVLVVHGFNTHGVWSVIRWAAMLAANGYDVAAFDQRDFSNDTDFTHPQSFGWKEAQDVLTAGRWLAGRPGVTAVGVVGFSEGAQNTVLAVGRDTTHVFSAALAFSAPADQDTQVWGTRQPTSCTSGCQYPATDALVSLVVPPPTGVPYTDVCAVLTDAAAVYHTTGFAILAQESAMHVQPAIAVPLLTVYSQDDSLVSSDQAAYMGAWQSGPLQRNLMVAHGEHAYFFDRWWQQAAILTYFRMLLPADAGITVTPTVNQTPGGGSFASQEVAPTALTRAAADAAMGPYVCDTAQGSPGQAAAAGNTTPRPSPVATGPTTATAASGTSPNTAAVVGGGAGATAVTLLASLGMRRRRRR